MIKSFAKMFAVVATVAAFTSCTTLTRGTTQNMMVTSNKPNTSVKLSTGQTGQTPVTFVVPRKDTVAVTATKSGYESQTKQSVPEVKGGAVGEAIAGSLFLWGPFNFMDYFNGSLKAHRDMHFDL